MMGTVVVVFRWAGFGLSFRGELFPSSALALQGMLHSLRPSHIPLSDQISTLWLSHPLSPQPCSVTSPGSISCFLFGLSVYKPNSGLTSPSTILTRWPLILIFLQQHHGVFASSESPSPAQANFYFLCSFCQALHRKLHSGAHQPHRTFTAPTSAGPHPRSLMLSPNSNLPLMCFL